MALPELNPNPLMVKTVHSVRSAELKLVSYTDHLGQQVNQFCAVIDKDRILLFDNKEFAGGTERTPAGFATGWLRDQILKKLDETVLDALPAVKAGG